MGLKRMMLPLFFVALATLLSFQDSVSARRLVQVTTYADPGTTSSLEVRDFAAPLQEQSTITQHQDFMYTGSVHESNEYKNLDEIDGLKLSISKLICESMDEGCESMDDSADHMAGSN